MGNTIHPGTKNMGENDVNLGEVAFRLRGRARIEINLKDLVPSEGGCSIERSGAGPAGVRNPDLP